jgi:hypothetical protein
VLQATLCLLNELDVSGLEIVTDTVRNRLDSCNAVAYQTALHVDRQNESDDDEQDNEATSFS